MFTSNNKYSFEFVSPWGIDEAIAKSDAAEKGPNIFGVTYDHGFWKRALQSLTDTDKNYTLIIECDDFLNGPFYDWAWGRRTQVAFVNISLLLQWLGVSVYRAKDVWQAIGKVFLIGTEAGAVEKITEEINSYPNSFRNEQTILYFSKINKQLDEINLPKNLNPTERTRVIKSIAYYIVKIKQIDIQEKYERAFGISSTADFLRREAQKHLFITLDGDSNILHTNEWYFDSNYSISGKVILSTEPEKKDVKRNSNVNPKKKDVKHKSSLKPKKKTVKHNSKVKRKK